MLTLIAALIILKGAEGFKAIGKVILCMIALIIDTFIILTMVLIGSGIHWLFA